MRDIIKKLESIKHKPHYHYLCWAGSTVCRVDEWGERKIYKCPHKGKKDWGLLHHKISPCETCPEGKIEGFLDLTEREECYNHAIDEAIETIKQRRKG